MRKPAKEATDLEHLHKAGKRLGALWNLIALKREHTSKVIRMLDDDPANDYKEDITPKIPPMKIVRRNLRWLDERNIYHGVVDGVASRKQSNTAISESATLAQLTPEHFLEDGSRVKNPDQAAEIHLEKAGSKFHKLTNASVHSALLDFGFRSTETWQTQFADYGLSYLVWEMRKLKSLGLHKKPSP
ncbi:hypothetical protein PRZ48_000005 [Zasmidium cellare]|uniref:Uncharacterized protein n=1 Tax=Zasmidium cellare TaxID=395010 RepID=A0ABR0EYJ1_ZASCE|nr:hypothetical protein PRZ48_000005 [Zasmidium cellare]